MGAGSFWSMAGIAPPNLLAVVLVDGHYTITGDQALGVPAVFGDVAAALGLATATAYTRDEIFTQVKELDPAGRARGPLRRSRVARTVALRRPAGGPLAFRGSR